MRKYKSMHGQSVLQTGYVHCPVLGAMKITGKELSRKTVQRPLLLGARNEESVNKQTVLGVHVNPSHALINDPNHPVQHTRRSHARHNLEKNKGNTSILTQSHNIYELYNREKLNVNSIVKRKVLTTQSCIIQLVYKM